MVVRLGQTSDVVVVNSQRYRILQGQSLQLQHISQRNVITIRGWARVRYDNGEDSLLTIPEFRTSNDPVAVTLARPSDVARMDGWVVDALVDLPLDDDVRRGQIYVKLYVDPFGPVLCSDYCYSTFGQVTLGTYIQSGPGGGSGDLQIITVKADGAPVASTTRTLAGVNAIRKVYGFVWYYNASVDVASRILSSLWRTPIGAVPTGFGASSANIVWQPASLTLTADEEGNVFADEKLSMINKDGTLTIENVTTAPTPFPILVAEDDTGVLNFIVTAGEVLDADVIYLVQEEWMVL